MKDKWVIALLSFCFLLFPCCEEQEFKTGTIRIRLTLPADYPDISLDRIPVRLTNQSQGVTYTDWTNREGEVEFELSAGICLLTVHQEITRGNRDYIASGGCPEIHFRANGETQAFDIPLEISTRGRLLIEELYFSCGLRPDGKTTYTMDQYLVVANNSDNIIYLDGYCIGQVAPSGSGKPSNWMLHTDMSEIPLFMMCWEFPGSGTDYPIQPGERQVIATNAVDHTAGENGIPAALDLSRVTWAFWNSSLTSSQITAGVTPLRLAWRGSGASYAFTMSGPSVILFRPDSDLDEWISDPAHIRKEPNNNSSMRYLHIPAAWIQEAVNFVSSPSNVGNSRLPINIDASPGIAGATGTGLAVRRKYRLEGERIRWIDTNNTAADFEAQKPFLKP